MRMCVRDLGGSGSRHDPLSVGFVVIGGKYCAASVKFGKT